MDDGTMYRPSCIHIHHGCPDIDWETVAHGVHGTLIQSKTYCKTCVHVCVRVCVCVCMPVRMPVPATACLCVPVILGSR